MSKRILSTLYLTLFCLFLPAVSGWAIKPVPPLQLSLLQVDLSEDQRRLTLTATANIDSSEVALSFLLAPGLILVEGEEEWKGPLAKGETRKLEITVQTPDKGPREVIGKAVTRLKEGGVFTQQGKLILNEDKKESPGPSSKRQEGDEKTLEFKGK